MTTTQISEKQYKVHYSFYLSGTDYMAKKEMLDIYHHLNKKPRIQNGELPLSEFYDGQHSPFDFNLSVERVGDLRVITKRYYGFSVWPKDNPLTIALSQSIMEGLWFWNTSYTFSASRKDDVAWLMEVARSELEDWGKSFYHLERVEE